MIQLEFSFVCCVKYVKEKGKFKQVVTPFHEWREYLCHVRNTEPSPIIDEETIQRKKSNDFASIDEMSAILELAVEAPITEASIKAARKKCPEFLSQDFGPFTETLCDLNLASREGEKIVCTSDSAGWLKMSLEDRAMYIYRHPSRVISNVKEDLSDHKHVREAEKSVARIANSGWVFMDDFIKGISIPLNHEHFILLQRVGRNWKYELPKYTNEEIEFFKAIVQKWLFEVGITTLGTKDGRECFCLTALGNKLFGDE